MIFLINICLSGKDDDIKTDDKSTADQATDEKTKDSNFSPKMYDYLNESLYQTHPLIYSMYGKHPALPSNLAMNLTQNQNPYLYQIHGNSQGPLNIFGSMLMNPMSFHWSNPTINPQFNPFQPYPEGYEFYQKQQIPKQIDQTLLQDQVQEVEENMDDKLLEGKEEVDKKDQELPKDLANKNKII